MVKYAWSLSSIKVVASIKSYVIGNAICGTHNVAFMRCYAPCIHVVRTRYAATPVIKASVQIDKRLFHPPLITRYVIYHAPVYDARGQNEYSRTAAPRRSIVRLRSITLPVFFIIDAVHRTLILN